MPDAVAASPGNALIALFTKIEDCGNTVVVAAKQHAGVQRTVFSPRTLRAILAAMPAPQPWQIFVP